MKDNVSIFLATPMYGGMCSGEYARSLAVATRELESKGYSFQFVHISNESLITRARNTLTKIFLDSGMDYLLFVDADQSFRVEDIERMINSGKNLIGAPVPMKSINWDAVKQAALDGKDLSEYTGMFNYNMLDSNNRINPSEPVEVKYVGSGMMLIHRSVFERVGHLVPTYINDSTSLPLGTKIQDFWSTSIDSDGRLLSEDFHFCNLYRSINGKVYLDFLSKVSHIGTYTFNGKSFE